MITLEEFKKLKAGDQMIDSVGRIWLVKASYPNSGALSCAPGFLEVIVSTDEIDDMIIGMEGSLIANQMWKPIRSLMHPGAKIIKKDEVSTTS